jgi:hypothetical protein
MKVEELISYASDSIDAVDLHVPLAGSQPAERPF